ncbi:Rpn family recombination-promoting nuclease/putative transposase [Ruania alkalisoli]|uniref:Rpn family recombination-promoting nuclease/putative transposase n=1 Tax=Ruania alkalisoli TaxID=2779775 RepID=A0A7M1SU84_9MICO|nr:Rpn family recombination-promoting nuclease/putative transposase [Ruania alkalisoli]QOR71149.1 Rpn family recombination-promoting nuclease/putative transposase [Ruania alkalisoli]
MASRNEHLNPHDAMFRAVVGVPANAASVLASVLPAEVAGGFDLGGLRPEPGSFVDAEMRQRHTDLLFSTHLNGKPALVYVLVEHQASSDRWMALRVLEYVTRICDRYRAQHSRERTLPAVLPVVVYQGRRRWNAPTRLEALYDVDAKQALGEFLPRHQFVLQDLTGVEVEALLAAPLTPAARLALAMLRFAPDQQHLAQVLDQFIDDLLILIGKHPADRMFATIMEYAYQVSDTNPEELQTFFHDLGPQAQEAYMSNTLERGVAQGVAKGRAEGAAAMLTRVLAAQFGALTPEQSARIQAATPDQLDAWVDRFTDATSIDDVLR